MLFTSLHHGLNVNLLRRRIIKQVKLRLNISRNINMILLKQLFKNIFIRLQILKSIRFSLYIFSSPRFHHLFLNLNIKIIENSLSFQILIIRQLSFQISQRRVIARYPFFLRHSSGIHHFRVHICELIVHLRLLLDLLREFMRIGDRFYLWHSTAFKHECFTCFEFSFFTESKLIDSFAVFLRNLLELNDLSFLFGLLEAFSGFFFFLNFWQAFHFSSIHFVLDMNKHSFDSSRFWELDVDVFWFFFWDCGGVGFDSFSLFSDDYFLENNCFFFNVLLFHRLSLVEHLLIFEVKILLSFTLRFQKSQRRTYLNFLLRKLKFRIQLRLILLRQLSLKNRLLLLWIQLRLTRKRKLRQISLHPLSLKPRLNLRHLQRRQVLIHIKLLVQTSHLGRIKFNQNSHC